jgi:hypothetical protein
MSSSCGAVTDWVISSRPMMNADASLAIEVSLARKYAICPLDFLPVICWALTVMAASRNKCCFDVLAAD